MPEADREGERYAIDQPQQTPGFFLKGTTARLGHEEPHGAGVRSDLRAHGDAGHRPRLLPGPDHGPRADRPDHRAAVADCDALFCTRGILRSVIPAECQKPMVLRASGGPSILREELSDEEIAMDMEDAMRLNAAGVGIQVFIGGEFETRSVHNMTKLVDAGSASACR